MAAPGRALVAREPLTACEPSQAHTQRPSPSAPFLAHLIATREQLPQTRERRRAEPSEAVAAYAAASSRLAAGG